MTQLFYEKYTATYTSPLNLLASVCEQHPVWQVDKTVYNIEGNVIELYLHLAHPVTGRLSYFSLEYTINSTLNWYMNTGFDTNLTASTQPGTLPYNGSSTVSISTGFTPESVQPREIYIVITDTMLWFTIKRYDNVDDLALYFGAYHNTTSIGTNDSFMCSNISNWFQFNYNGTIYVDTTQHNDTSFLQGAFNLDRNSQFFYLPALVDGSKQITTNTLWVNTDNSTDNVSFNYIGYFDDQVAYVNSTLITQTKVVDTEFLVVPLNQTRFPNTGIYIDLTNLDQTTYLSANFINTPSTLSNTDWA